MHLDTVTFDTDTKKSEYTFFEGMKSDAHILNNIENWVYIQQLSTVLDELERDENVASAIKWFIEDTRSEYETFHEKHLPENIEASNDQKETRNTCGNILDQFLIHIKDSVWSRKEKLFTFEQIKDTNKLRNVIEILINERNKSTDYKEKIHLTYVISKILDRIITLDYRYKRIITKLDKLNYVLQPGDILMMNDQTSWTDDEKIIGMIWDWDARNGYSLTHAAMHKWTQKANRSIWSLNDYLNKLVTCNIYVFRYRKSEENLAEQLAHNGMYNSSRHTTFDTAKALNPDVDMSGGPIWKQQSFDSAELVNDCMNSLKTDDQIDTSALSEKYRKGRELEQVYISEF